MLTHKHLERHIDQMTIIDAKCLHDYEAPISLDKSYIHTDRFNAVISGQINTQRDKLTKRQL